MLKVIQRLGFSIAVYFEKNDVIICTDSGKMII